MSAPCVGHLHSFLWADLAAEVPPPGTLCQCGTAMATVEPTPESAALIRALDRMYFFALLPRRTPMDESAKHAQQQREVAAHLDTMAPVIHGWGDLDCSEAVDALKQAVEKRSRSHATPALDVDAPNLTDGQAG